MQEFVWNAGADRRMSRLFPQIRIAETLSPELLADPWLTPIFSGSNGSGHFLWVTGDRVFGHSFRRTFADIFDEQ